LNPVPTLASYSFKNRFNIIWTSVRGLRRGIVLSDVTNIIYYAFLISLMLAACSAYLILLGVVTVILLYDEHKV
jgi:hypothetical protein